MYNLAVHDARVTTSFFRHWMGPDVPAPDDASSLIFAPGQVPERQVALLRQVSVLRGQVQDLSATVAALIEALVARGGVDRGALESRVGELLAARCAPPVQPPVRCVRCQQSVPANTTVITADGVMCDPKCP